MDPWILVEFQTTKQHTIRLCDFASAGAFGTYYRSVFRVRSGGLD
ncbi:MAG: hypothetical protein O2960_10735 [Verrucomicrobia bacterium]|nr:hypothetical protein [Verrucomicrobiota bacterium]